MGELDWLERDGVDCGVKSLLLVRGGEGDEGLPEIRSEETSRPPKRAERSG